MAHLSRASRSDILTTGGLPPHRRYGRSGCVGGAWETTDSRHEDFRDYRLKLGSIPEMIGLTRLDFNFLTFQTPGFWSHSCCILTSISPWEDLFSSPIFSLRGQFPNWAVLCLALEGGWTLMDLKPPENRVVIVEVKVFFSCKSGEIYVWHMWHMTLWDSDIAVLQTPVLDIYHGVLLPWFHTRDQEKMRRWEPVIVNQSSFGILVTLVVVWDFQVPSNWMGAKICEFGSLGPLTCDSSMLYQLHHIHIFSSQAWSPLIFAWLSSLLLFGALPSGKLTVCFWKWP